MIKFYYFNQAHLIYLAFSLALAALFIALPFFIPQKRVLFASLLGWLSIAFNIFEGFYRVFFEGFSFFQAMPLHFCSVSLIMSGIYLVTRKDLCFQIVYYYAFGALAALLFPGIEHYNHPLFLQLFLVNHMLVLTATLYGLLWLRERPTRRGLLIAIILTLVLFPTAYMYNSVYFTNFMFMNTYLLPQLSFIKPFWLYRLLLAGAIILIMCACYMPFRKKENRQSFFSTFMLLLTHHLL